MSMPFKKLKALRILTDGGAAEPDYTTCKTAGQVIEHANDAMYSAYYDVKPIYLLTEEGWFYGEMLFEFRPVLEHEVPLSEQFKHDILVEE